MISAADIALLRFAPDGRAAWRALREAGLEI